MNNNMKIHKIILYEIFFQTTTLLSADDKYKDLPVVNLIANRYV